MGVDTPLREIHMTSHATVALRALVCASCLLFVWPAAATAMPITFAFSGFLTDDPLLDPDDPFGGTIAAGTTFSGDFTFDSTALDGIADPQTANYTSLGAPFGLSVLIGGNLFTATDALFIGVANDLAGRDQYLVTGIGGDLTVFLMLEDLTATVFASDALPLTAPPLGAFAIRSFFLDDPDVGGNQVQIQGEIDSLTCASCDAAVVPEPGTLALFGTGLAALLRRRRRASSSTRAVSSEVNHDV